MKVGHVTERTDASSASSFLDSDELERTGIDLGTTGRLQLMARLAEGTGLQIPPAAQQALQMSGSLAFGAVAEFSFVIDLQTRLSQQTEGELSFLFVCFLSGYKCSIRHSCACIYIIIIVVCLFGPILSE